MIVGYFSKRALRSQTTPLAAYKYLADPNGIVYDGRVYMYCSNDESNNGSYNLVEYTLISSDDLVNWRDHGEVFNAPRTPAGPRRRMRQPWWSVTINSICTFQTADSMYEGNGYIAYRNRVISGGVEHKRSVNLDIIVLHNQTSSFRDVAGKAPHHMSALVSHFWPMKTLR